MAPIVYTLQHVLLMPEYPKTITLILCLFENARNAECCVEKDRKQRQEQRDKSWRTKKE